jgi:hypothetical protein
MKLTLYDASGLEKPYDYVLHDEACASSPGSADIAATSYPANMANCSALGTGSFTLNTLYALPFIAPMRPANVDQIDLEVTSGATGNGRLGIYKNKNEGSIYPGALAYRSSSLALSNAIISAVPTKTLTPGELYWLAICLSATNTLRAFGQIASLPTLGMLRTGVVWNTGISVAFTYAALPDPFPASGAHMTNATVPVMRRSYST